LPYLEQGALQQSGQNQGTVLTARRDDTNNWLGEKPLKVLIAPADNSPAKQVDWAWPYTFGGAARPVSLTSYVPNLRVFGQPKKDGDWSIWSVWGNSGGGQAKLQAISDGTSNTLFVVEKPMITGDAIVKFKDWGWSGQTGDNDGANVWSQTDQPPEGMALFGYNCNDPSQTWDDEDGIWWQGNCNFTGGEYYQPPRPNRPPEQRSWRNIYPIGSGGVQCLMGDGSVRSVSTSVSVIAWSAGVTPRGGEATNLD